MLAEHGGRYSGHGDNYWDIISADKYSLCNVAAVVDDPVSN